MKEPKWLEATSTWQSDGFYHHNFGYRFKTALIALATGYASYFLIDWAVESGSDAPLLFAAPAVFWTWWATSVAISGKEMFKSS